MDCCISHMICTSPITGRLSGVDLTETWNATVGMVVNANEDEIVSARDDALRRADDFFFLRFHPAADDGHAIIYNRGTILLWRRHRLAWP